MNGVRHVMEFPEFAPCVTLSRSLPLGGIRTYGSTSY